MKICKNCGHCVFDETWGEYKCKFYQRRIHENTDGDDSQAKRRSRVRTRKKCIGFIERKEK